jgi:hypothetical protein
VRSLFSGEPERAKGGEGGRRGRDCNFCPVRLRSLARSPLRQASQLVLWVIRVCVCDLLGGVKLCWCVWRCVFVMRWYLCASGFCAPTAAAGGEHRGRYPFPAAAQPIPLLHRPSQAPTPSAPPAPQEETERASARASKRAAGGSCGEQQQRGAVGGPAGCAGDAPSSLARPRPREAPQCFSFRARAHTRSLQNALPLLYPQAHSSSTASCQQIGRRPRGERTRTHQTRERARPPAPPHVNPSHRTRSSPFLKRPCSAARLCSPRSPGARQAA